ncbi:FabG Dehydrogenase with different specificities (related to short-chain alcohol dehydrogenase) [Pyrenophora tritici-repentis]|nr:FabG Dehydrogenase [Pyrenophora tritici-repentis]KAI0576878.1 FabG Dehydrogenase with different specificities (related to short-chain alcohol dehydrogenase) [Pyrenophora tritici-repentis]KAI0587642.1 FabG Dehydrogenase with different specificities (related to short-chain alcohol dehydrogenase) [Pyrenophora tritici-repentis]KAI0611023.1 FabG Dehydrogenase with different specificities (related to short-chain alcohol dehydrogenase) [Pyrenophora tritici-repentis]KAI0623709.1 FabG Dehydrogenase w
MDVTAPIRPNDLFSAKGLVVVITGGGSGLGLAIASTFYQNGAAKIYILGRRHDVLLNAVEKLQSSVPSDAQNPTSVKEIVCDVTSLSSIQAAASFIEKETGYIDVLINNAGVLGPKNSKEIYAATNIHELSASMLLGWDTWSAALAINTQSVIGVSATFLPLLEAANTRRGWAPGKVPATTGTPRARDTSQLSAHDITPDDDRMAHIITIASVASFNRWISAGLAYSATKCAAMHLGKMMSTFLAEWGVRSNIVCPGPYPSEMTVGNNAVFGTGQLPQGRMGGFNDVGGMVLFLVGKGGAYVNGAVQLSDGGRVGVFPGTY